MKIKTIVIDDEFQNRELLIELIHRKSGFEVVGQADRVKSGVEVIIATRPDLVFLDIRMPDGNAFELLKHFSKIDFFVVFVSAFDHYALRAFEFSAVDYILKPIDYGKFEHLQLKLLAMFRSKLLADEGLTRLMEQVDVVDLVIKKIQVHAGNRVTLLPLSDIVYAQAEEGNTVFKTTSGAKFSSSKQLSDFDFIFESYDPILRISKGVFINVNHMESYSKGSTCLVYMKDGTEFEVSKRKKTEILGVLLGRT